MATNPRSGTKRAQAPATFVRFSTPVVIGSIATNGAVVTINLPRQFKPDRFIQVRLGGALDTGLAIANAYVTGNAPNSYQAKIQFNNTTGAPVVSAQTIVEIVQV